MAEVVQVSALELKRRLDAGEPLALLGTANTPATWSARTFITVFDTLMLAMWPLAMLVVSRFWRGAAGQ